MSIQEFIRNSIMLPRLRRNGVLVVYDPDRRYRDLCLELATDTLPVVDASESSIVSREQALQTLGQLGQPNTKLEGMLVYVPARVPLTDEEKQNDPFSLYTVCGSVFPDGDGDEYINLCLKAKPDQSTEIRRVFADNPNPAFVIIDAIGGGAGWPSLQGALGVESAREIIFALLVPTARQKETLAKQAGWVEEAKDLFAASLGLNLISRGKTWSSVADELWRFLLFSEFIMDLPGATPDSLGDVPRAPEEARPLVEDICDRLRNDQRTRGTYIERAEAVEQELTLVARCSGVTDLGIRDTFPFEERWFLEQAAAAFQRDDTDAVRAIVDRQRRSVWASRGESQFQWGLVKAALALSETCADFIDQLSSHSQSIDAVIDLYTNSLREADRLHREFEQAVTQYISTDGMMGDVIRQARGAYRRLAEKTQSTLMRHLESAGWPPVGRLSNADVFDELVSPLLQESGRRVALFLVDALRYELGVALEKELSEDDSVTLQVSCAQLPSVTSVGMAGLLPDAGQALSITKQESGIATALGETVLANVTQRMDVLRRRYGQRFAETQLSDFVRGTATAVDSAELLVLRSTTIDSHMEGAPEAALSMVFHTLRQIRVAINKLKEMGFQNVVIATDHGFVLNTYAEPGDVCTKPSGDWVNVHERMLLGSGTQDLANLVMPCERLGIRGDFAQAACPKALVTYRSGQLYFHGGVSLQECILPVILVQLQKKEERHEQITVSLNYRNGATRITTRLPVVDVAFSGHDLFSQTTELEILLEAQDKKGNVVGEAGTGGPANPATGTITLRGGEGVQVPLKMQLEFEGKFTVKALNPVTLATYATLDLQTDYTV